MAVAVCVCSCLPPVVWAQQQQQTPADQLGAETVGVAASTDLAVAATYGHGGGQGGHDDGKYFMYAHQPSKKEYEFGYKRGNGYHNIERYEKAGPHHNFKTKVRWEDAKGGHGEHYWDYNHAPKYHDDHHGDDHGGYGHGDDHGGYGHGDDHHDDGYGHDDHGHGDYGHDDHGHDSYGHDDHGGYHSQPVPEYAHPVAASPDSEPPTVAASSRTVSQLAKREGTAGPSKVYESSDDYRPKKKTPKKVQNKVGVDKDSGLGKKNYQYYNKKQTFEYKKNSGSAAPDLSKEGESLSAFPELLGFNPYLPPEIVGQSFYPQSAVPSSPISSSGGRRVSQRVPAVTQSAPAPRVIFPTTGFGHRSGLETDAAAVNTKTPAAAGEDTQATESKVVSAVTKSVEPPALSGLSFDPETGRVYNEGTGVWYTLEPIQDP
ncbi:uncharacterized protein LOC121875202 [Homarus americanus]|uniref:Uncharacterized protein n=1 Tax=Homarus americanus TaxID=6706 RepID=A0A8J5MS07_HOMAM|nr:uncharacterized protein LOC121875202 [Homarus americanus]KAG7161317.1 hypothetical protein Hamer_G023062 [Homarus americanus]